mmetsp:Transcript_13807/g.17369  ORF Transcript_13807/g.17369 Transcript_13807/m.17369 type:complete len:87 (-) Transcript_13807:406-666(-)
MTLLLAIKMPTPLDPSTILREVMSVRSATPPKMTNTPTNKPTSCHCNANSTRSVHYIEGGNIRMPGNAPNNDKHHNQQPYLLPPQH